MSFTFINRKFIPSEPHTNNSAIEVLIVKPIDGLLCRLVVIISNDGTMPWLPSQLVLEDDNVGLVRAFINLCRQCKFKAGGGCKYQIDTFSRYDCDISYVPEPLPAIKPSRGLMCV